MATAYDVVRYPSWPIPETHPAALSVFASLYGLAFVPFERCRVLEIGCGEGVNLMDMAIAAPDAEFVGFEELRGQGIDLRYDAGADRVVVAD